LAADGTSQMRVCSHIRTHARAPASTKVVWCGRMRVTHTTPVVCGTWQVAVWPVQDGGEGSVTRGRECSKGKAKAKKLSKTSIAAKASFDIKNSQRPTDPRCPLSSAPCFFRSLYPLSFLRQRRAPHQGGRDMRSWIQHTNRHAIRQQVDTEHTNTSTP
jgi:hypothetical protein